MWFVYWHRQMNSGLYKFDREEDARKIADDFAKKDDIYRVVVLEANIWEVIKGGLS